MQKHYLLGKTGDMMSYDSQYMKRAAATAKRGIEAGCGGPFGCVIVRKSDGAVLADTHNTVVRDNDPTAHGEVNAIRMACKNKQDFDLSDCELYTTSEPCPMCMGAIMWARISKVYSAMNIKDAADIGFDDEPFYTEMIHYAQGEKNAFVDVEFVEEQSCKDLFEEYKNTEHTKY